MTRPLSQAPSFLRAPQLAVAYQWQPASWLAQPCILAALTVAVTVAVTAAVIDAVPVFVTVVVCEGCDW